VRWKKIVGSAPEGFFVPNDIASFGRSDMQGYQGQRDLNVTSAVQGGNTVQTDVLGGSMIELLRNRQTIRRLGARSLDGLVGNVAIPRQTGAASGYSVPEQGALTESTQAIDQLALTPKRIGAFNDYSKQLLAQSSIDVENFIRMDLMQVLAILSDFLAINGTGATNQPTGILATTGIGSVTFAGAATWAKILDFETQVSNANADVGSLAYLTTPSARAKLKGATKIAASQYADFLWEKGSAPGEGIINSYLALATLQVPGNRMIFGNFADMIVAGWAGLDVVVDPYSQATQGTVRITVNQFMDVGVRHAGSFVASSDTAAA
jgi:HK97 family phage major capsid protein